ncbi:MAG: tetratricopeptide repeat protein [Rhodocyclales bacterium]|nr:tetratricopeptide repeat protein [Rhodocyclales bacterium]
MSQATRSSGRRDFGKGGKREPLDPELMSLMRLIEAMRFADVEALARRILGRRPNQPLALKALSFALIGLERYRDALPILDEAVRRNPRDAELHNNRGIVLSSLTRWEESLISFQRARALTPDDPELLKNMAGALLRMERWNEAVPILLEAIEIHPGDFVEAIVLLAGALLGANRIEEAWACFREIHRADETNLRALYQLISCNLKRCHWEEFSDLLTVLRTKSDDFSAPLVSPFTALAFPGLTGPELRRIAENFAREIVPSDEDIAVPAWNGFSRNTERRRLRIGYISGDFREHPVGRIIPDALEHHDHSRVEVFGYSTMADDGSDLHKRLVATFDQFVDLVDMPVPKVVERIRADRIDVLIDLSGWTAHGRREALVSRCAPVQVNWLGYAGTMGHSSLADYILGDPTVTPAEHASFYTETIAQMPYCYMPADSARRLWEAPSRANAGLPETAFVFCSFNSCYKYSPPLFDLWADLLSSAPGSVLWLGHPGESAAAALIREIQMRGIETSRLVFADRVDAHMDHLVRLQLADLALDPFPYNSHSTGIETLWAGVPMVALKGTTFAARVGASMLGAAGLADLVATTPEDYRAIALRLFRNPQQLADVRKRLIDARATAPLFDMTAFARALEDVYFRMWEQYCAGENKPIIAQSPMAS